MLTSDPAVLRRSVAAFAWLGARTVTTGKPNITARRVSDGCRLVERALVGAVRIRHASNVNNMRIIMITVVTVVEGKGDEAMRR